MPAVVSRGRGRRTISEINMVPFIDVMLVLLIIFMVTAPLIAPSMIDLPSVGQGGQAARPDRADRHRQGRVAGTQDRRQGPQAHAARSGRCRQGPADGQTSTAVVISADRSVKYETVVKVMDTLQRAGIQRVGLSVQLAP
jgi:biopolymer transport protein TolR